MDRIEAMLGFTRVVERASFIRAAEDLGLPASTGRQPRPPSGTMVDPLSTLTKLAASQWSGSAAHPYPRLYIPLWPMWLWAFVWHVGRLCTIEVDFESMNQGLKP